MRLNCCLGEEEPINRVPEEGAGGGVVVGLLGGSRSWMRVVEEGVDCVAGRGPGSEGSSVREKENEGLECVGDRALTTECSRR